MSEQTLIAGDVIAYEDMANPRMEYLVLAVVADNAWNPYVLQSLTTSRVIQSDCGQRGWSLVRRGVDGMSITLTSDRHAWLIGADDWEDEADDPERII